MFDNPLNQDTVYYLGLSDNWQTMQEVCENVNAEGFVLTIAQTMRLLQSLSKAGRVESKPYNDGMLTLYFWRKAAKPRGGEVVK